MQGPSLYGSSAAGRFRPSFEYSDALRRRGRQASSGTPHPRSLYCDPEGVVPGTAMSAPPLRDEAERADLIAYLALSGPYKP